ncbi:MAG: HEAT repeat domain-containing protein [Deltaproteobacteria bacterium]|nr:HEAT repeat domain-containing protein [Deltaproteobacteria bacterium]
MNLNELKKNILDGNEEERRSGISALLAFKGKDSENEAFMLAVRALGDESWRVRKAATEVIEEAFFNKSNLAEGLISALRVEDNAGVRNSAAELLTKLGPAALRELVATLGDEDENIRKFAVDIIGDICAGKDDEDSKEAITYVIGTLTKLLKDTDDNVRGSASEALGKIGGQEVINALIKALHSESGESDNDDNLWLRFATLEALGKIGRGVPVEPLIRFFSDSVLRKAVIDALGSSLDIKAIAHLTDALGDKGRRTRTSALTNIIHIYENLTKAEQEEARKIISQGVTLEPIVELLDSPLIEVKKGAIVIIGIMGSNACCSETASALLANSDDEALEELITETFIRICTDNIEILSLAFESADDKTRSFISHVLGLVGDKSALPTLIKGAEDPYGHTRQCSLTAIGRLKDVSALPDIIKHIHDKYVDVEEAAVKAIAMIGSKHPEEVLSALKNYSTDKDARTRRNITTIYGGLGIKEVLPDIELSLKDADKEIRKAAAKALGSLGFSEGLDALRIALADEETSVRIAAVQSLTNFSNGDREELLQLAVTDEDIWVRSTAIKGLGSLSTPSALKTLYTGAKDPAAPVAINAIEALSRLTLDAKIKSNKNTFEDITSTIFEATSHVEPQVSELAKTRLREIKERI